MKNEVFKFIEASGAKGVLIKEIAEQFGITTKKSWYFVKQLRKTGCIYLEKDERRSRVFAGVKMTEPKIEQPKVQPKKVGTEMPPVFNSILEYASRGNAVMMTGPAGTGKGFIARHVAKALDAEFYEVNAVKNSYDLTGFVDSNSRFVRTPFYDACKAVAEGKKAVFLFDEMDCSDPEVLKIFNEALASKEFTFPNDEHLEFEDLIMLSACNTMGTGADEMYCGQQLDASTLNRFVLIRVDYNRRIEMNIARGDEELVDFIDAFRRQTEINGIAVVISYRNIKQIVSMHGSKLVPMKQVMKDCLIKSMAQDDLMNILANIPLRDNVYYRACRGENVNWKDAKMAYAA